MVPTQGVQKISQSVATALTLLTLNKGGFATSGDSKVCAPREAV